MTETVEIPQSLQMTFRRLLNRIPPDLREDVDVQKKLVLYLKAGGEKLARCYLTACQERFPEDIRFVKAKPPEVESNTESGEKENGDAAAEQTQ